MNVYDRKILGVTNRLTRKENYQPHNKGILSFMILTLKNLHLIICFYIVLLSLSYCSVHTQVIPLVIMRSQVLCIALVFGISQAIGQDTIPRALERSGKLVSLTLDNLRSDLSCVLSNKKMILMVLMDIVVLSKLKRFSF